MKKISMLAILLIACPTTNLFAQAFAPSTKSQADLQRATSQQKALHEQADSLIKAAQEQEAEQRRVEQRQDAADRAQQLIQSQQNQQQQLQNSINRIANQVGANMRSQNNSTDTDQPTAFWDPNRQEYRSKDGGPAPTITYAKPDGSVDYSGIPVEAIDPSAQVDVHYRRGNPSPLQTSSLTVTDQPYQPPQRLGDLFNDSQAGPNPSNPDSQQPTPSASLFSELAHNQDVSDGSGAVAIPTDGNSASSSTQPSGDSTGRLQDLSDSARDLFGDAKAVAKKTGRTLTDELFGQVRNGEDVDIRAAAKSGIDGKLQEMKGAAVDMLDDKTRSLISQLPEDKRFDYQTFYNTFISPKTQVMTPFQAKQNIGAYFNEMVGKRLDEFFGTAPAP